MCKEHVIREVYETPPELLQTKLEEYETAWPESKDSTLFIICYSNTTSRNFFSSQQHESKDLRREEGKAWLHSYLN